MNSGDDYTISLPATGNHNLDPLHEFLAVVRVLVQAGEVLGVPPQDLIELYKSRTRNRDSKDLGRFLSELQVLCRTAEDVGVLLKDLIELYKIQLTAAQASSNFSHSDVSTTVSRQATGLADQISILGPLLNTTHPIQLQHGETVPTREASEVLPFLDPNLPSMDPHPPIATLPPPDQPLFTDFTTIQPTPGITTSIQESYPTLVGTWCSYQSWEGQTSSAEDQWLCTGNPWDPAGGTKGIPQAEAAEIGGEFNRPVELGYMGRELGFTQGQDSSAPLEASTLSTSASGQGGMIAQIPFEGEASVGTGTTLFEPWEENLGTLQSGPMVPPGSSNFSTQSQSSKPTPIPKEPSLPPGSKGIGKIPRSTIKMRDIRPRAPFSQNIRGGTGCNGTNESLNKTTEIKILNTMSIQKASRRKPFSSCRRVEIGETRKQKACIRCHRQRIRCFPNPEDRSGDCLTCISLKGPTLSGLPCLRYKISDSQLLDKGPHPRFSWTRRFTSMKICEIEQWKSRSIKTITLTQDVGHASYALQVREFVTLPGDSVARTWNGPHGELSHPCAPYAIANMGEAAKVFLTFVETHIQTFLNHYISKDDALLSITYQMALDHSRLSQVADERALLDSVLRLWVASRMENKQERISSEEVLGMTPQDRYSEAGNYGKYLVPPVMQAQIEILTTAMILLPMKAKVLKLLEKLMEKNLVRSWFTIYLALFILMHSFAMLTRAEAVRAAREGNIGGQSRFFNPQIVEELHNGAKTMLAHFHYGNKGSHPFAMNWNRNTNISFAELNAEQVRFIKETAELVKEKRSHFEHIKNNHVFEDDYFFISQLYELGWQPLHTV